MKPIVDPKGQWAHPGKVTTIPGNNITMKGVNYPVLGISNTGDKKLMLPGKNYKFKGKSVTEYPWLNKYQAGGGTKKSGATRQLLEVNRQATQPDAWKYGILPAINKAMNRKLNGYLFSTNINIEPTNSVKGTVRGAGLEYKTPIKKNSQLSLKANLGINNVDIRVPGVEKSVYNKFQAVPQVGISYKFNNGGHINKYQSGGDLPPLYVPSTEDPRYKAYSDSLSLYTEAKNAHNKLNYKALERDSMDWLNVMTSPYSTSQMRATMKKPSITDYTNYDQLAAGKSSRGNYIDTKPLDKDKLKVTSSKITYKDSDGIVEYDKKSDNDDAVYEHIIKNRKNPIKPHYISYYGEGHVDFVYKKPVQPVKVANNLTLDPFYVYPEASTKLPETPIKITTNKTVSPKLKGPVNNKVTGIMPSFMIPSTGSSVKGDRDLYEWDYELKKYTPTRIVSGDEGRHVYDAIYKSSLNSLNSELNNSNLGSKKRNPFVK